MRKGDRVIGMASGRVGRITSVRSNDVTVMVRWNGNTHSAAYSSNDLILK
jgi:preprotein translocase subunit YajC